MAKLTEKQKRFCEYYLQTGNATESATRAGYSKKTAKVTASENLTKPNIRSYIDERMEKADKERIASANEVLMYLTSVMRGKEDEEVIVIEGEGDGCSSARKIRKELSAKDRLRAAELLGKRHRLFIDKIESEVTQAVIFEGIDNVED